MKGERFTRWVASASNEQALVAMQQFYGDASQIKAQAPAGRRVLSAGSCFSLSGTSCPHTGARHPWRACRCPRPSGQMGRAPVAYTVTHAHLVCTPLLDKKK